MNCNMLLDESGYIICVIIKMSELITLTKDKQASLLKPIAWAQGVAHDRCRNQPRHKMIALIIHEEKWRTVCGMWGGDWRSSP